MSADKHDDCQIKYLGRVDYDIVWQAMRQFTDERVAATDDEIWLVEHPPVYTQGQAGKPEHMLAQTGIPIVASDRGGQITYHGPGQLVVYPLLNLKRLGLGVRDLVSCIEQSIIDLLAELEIIALARADAPGVYVKDKKIASLGLRVRRGCSYHGLALNVDMDLSPFGDINPCGYADMQMTQLIDENPGQYSLESLGARLADLIRSNSGKKKQKTEVVTDV